MGQFKPMVKMETTEPTVELKLKKGGHVNMKKGGKAEAGHKKMAGGGGAMAALAGKHYSHAGACNAGMDSLFELYRRGVCVR